MIICINETFINKINKGNNIELINQKNFDIIDFIFINNCLFSL